VGSATSAMPAMFHWTIDRSEYKQVMRWSPWEVRATQSGHTFLLLLLAELVLAVLSSSPSSARGRLCALGSVVTYLKSAVLNNLFFFFFFLFITPFYFSLLPHDAIVAATDNVRPDNGHCVRRGCLCGSKKKNMSPRKKPQRHL